MYISKPQLTVILRRLRGEIALRRACGVPAGDLQFAFNLLAQELN